MKEIENTLKKLQAIENMDIDLLKSADPSKSLAMLAINYEKARKRLIAKLERIISIGNAK